MYCIWDKTQEKIVKVQGRLDTWIEWSSGDKTSPGIVGTENGSEILVNFVDNKIKPRAYHKLMDPVDTYDLATNTVIRNYTEVRDSSPTREDVIDEAERRIFSTLQSTRDLFEMFMDWMELKEKIDSGGTLSEGEKVRLSAIRALWQRKKQVKIAAQNILQLDPIPDDFADDSRWP